MSVGITSKSGSVFGGILLITGSCVGAGMLALPVITGLGGFIPASFLFFTAWLFMTVTALTLLEVNLAMGFHLSLISIAEKTMGQIGKFLCWILFLFLFYSLNVAYISASGGILSGIASSLGAALPAWAGSLLFTLFFGVIIYFGTRPVDYLNRFLMLGLVLAYVVLISFGARHINGGYLLTQNWGLALGALPILVISFGFHNMIPSLAGYFKGDRRRLRLTVFVGSLIPLLIYLLWEAVMLGIVPLEGRLSLMGAMDQGQAVTTVLYEIVGSSWIGMAAESFALFAIITSFLAQSLSLVDFLSDGLKIPKEKAGRVFLILLTLAPPFLFSFFNPGLFITALTLAGGFSAVILFGVIPVVMLALVRKKFPRALTPLIIFALFIFCLELVSITGWTL